VSGQRHRHAPRRAHRLNRRAERGVVDDRESGNRETDDLRAGDANRSDQNWSDDSDSGGLVPRQSVSGQGDFHRVASGVHAAQRANENGTREHGVRGQGANSESADGVETGDAGGRGVEIKDEG